nr:MAG TPA: hypothetical protein [Caudoviricetes sp.]
MLPRIIIYYQCVNLVYKVVRSKANKKIKV